MLFIDGRRDVRREIFEGSSRRQTSVHERAPLEDHVPFGHAVFSLDMPPALRANVDYVFILRENIIANASAFKSFFGFFLRSNNSAA